jgi:Flp pilus assembly protein TadD
VTTDTAVGLNRAATMIELGRYDEAASLLAGMVATAPDAPRGWSLLSRAHLGAGRAAEAVQAARRAGALNPSDDWPFRLASTALLSLGRGQEAVAAAVEARRQAPNFWRCHVCLAQAALAVGDRQLAADAVAAALAIAPDEADVQFTAGKVALGRGNLATAREHQQAALAIDPAHSGAINELGRISLRERDVSSAAGHFLRAARSAPGVAIFGRNTEVALAKVLTNITVPVALVLAIAIDTPILTRIEPVPYVLALVAASAMACGYAVFLVRKLPPDGRRHLARMVRRRQWLLTIVAVVAVVVGLATFAALVLALTSPAGRSGSAALDPGLAVIFIILAAQLIVTKIIRRARRNIR